MKRVFFVRHGQSEENVKFQDFCEGIHGIRELKLPSHRQFQSSVQLLQCQLDSDLSELGKCEFLILSCFTP